MADTFNQFDRIPPHDLEAERCVIGSMMLAGNEHTIVDDVRELLRPECFYQADHGVLFNVMTRLRSDDKPIDAVIVRAELAQAGLLGEVGGVAHLAQILNSVPSAAHAAHY